MAEILNREDKKKELKKRVIQTSANKGGSKKVGSGGRKPGRARIFVLLAVILLLVGGVAAVLLLTQRQYQSYTVNWSQSFGANGSTVEAADYIDYELYRDGMLKVTRDGISYLNDSGKTVWNQAYEMRTPVVSVNGEYCAVADQGQNDIFIMNSSGTTGQARTTLPIVKLSVSSKGVVYALIEDDKASYITVFTKEGVALDITIKSVLSGDGYPVDLSVSPDGTECIVSFVYLKNGTVQNKVIFYNLDEIGKNAGTNRVVGGFEEEFSGHMVGRVHFSDDTHAQAFYDGGIAFFSTKVLTSPALLVNVPVEQTIRSIAYDEEYVGIITDNTETDEPYRLTVYDTSGKQLFTKPIQYNYNEFVIDQGHVILSNESSLQLYNMSGRLRYDERIEIPVVKAAMGSGIGTNMLIGSSDSMASIRLK